MRLDYILRTKIIALDPNMCVAARVAPYRAFPGTRLSDGLAGMPDAPQCRKYGDRGGRARPISYGPS